jgi:protein-L-isoaspartate(D-aspartate) O-methyltransferase
MVEHDLLRRGIDDERVLAAMAEVPREAFVPEALASQAYDDNALPIGSRQTISQPYIVAAMAQAAEVGPGDRVLEIGTGSGYGAAVLRRTGAAVVTVERLAELAARARHALEAVGLDDVRVVTGDGTLGWPDAAPYDAIVVTAAGPVVPDTLVEQLVDGGRLVMPVGPRHGPQRLVVIERHGEDHVERDLGGVAFVPLVGDEGW